MSEKKLGIALGSGAARGCAHIGVLEVLKENGFPPVVVSGTSIGSIMGAAWCSDTLEMVKEAVLELDWRKLLYLSFDVKRIRSGLVDGQRVIDFIGDHLDARTFEELKYPFSCVAADLMSGEQVVFSEGSLIDAIRASISIPGMFKPVYRNGRVLVDGGVVNPVPVEQARALGADVVIGVDINHGRLERARKSLPRNVLEDAKKRLREQKDVDFPDRVRGWIDRLEALKPVDLGSARRWLAPDPVPNIFDVLGNSIRIMEVQVAAARAREWPADITLHPQVGDVETLEFNRATEMIAVGRLCAEEALPQIEAALS